MYNFSKNKTLMEMPKGEYEMQIVDFKSGKTSSDIPYISVILQVRDDVEDNPKEWKGKKHSYYIGWDSAAEDYRQSDLERIVNGVARKEDNISFESVDEITTYLRGAFTRMTIFYTPSKDGNRVYTNYKFVPTTYMPKTIQSVATSEDYEEALDSDLPF